MGTSLEIKQPGAQKKKKKLQKPEMISTVKNYGEIQNTEARAQLFTERCLCPDVGKGPKNCCLFSKQELKICKKGRKARSSDPPTDSKAVVTEELKENRLHM